MLSSAYEQLYNKIELQISRYLWKLSIMYGSLQPAGMMNLVQCGVHPGMSSVLLIGVGKKAMENVFQ